MDILSRIQTELNAPKNQRNSFGKYNYRSCEDILEGLKPLLKETHSSVTLTDSIEMVGNRIYVKATARLYSNNKEGFFGVIAEATAFAREPESQKGMNEAQITGSASSYARKYALNGLFAIDDNKDSDTDEHHNNAKNRPTEINHDDIKRKKIDAFFKSGKLDESVKEGYINDLRSKSKSYGQVIAELGIK